MQRSTVSLPELIWRRNDARDPEVTRRSERGHPRQGRVPPGLLRHVHLPLLRVPLATSALLVFVDTLKELPAALVLRPFNTNTLAVRAFELASDERLADAALPALAILLAGVAPVLLLTRSMRPAEQAAPVDARSPVESHADPR